MDEKKQFEQILEFEKYFNYGKNIIIEAILEEYPISYRPYIYKQLCQTKVFFNCLPSSKALMVDKFLKEENLKFVRKLLDEYGIEPHMFHCFRLFPLGIENKVHKKILIDTLHELKDKSKVKELMDKLSLNEDSYCNLFFDTWEKYKEAYVSIKAYYQNKYSYVYDEDKRYQKYCDACYNKGVKEIIKYMYSNHLLSKEDVARYERKDFDYTNYQARVFFTSDLTPTAYTNIPVDSDIDRIMKSVYLRNLIMDCHYQYQYDILKVFPISEAILKDIKDYDVELEDIGYVLNCMVSETEWGQHFINEYNFKQYVNIDISKLYKDKYSFWMIVIHELIHSIENSYWNELDVVREVMTQYRAKSIYKKISDKLLLKTGFIDFDLKEVNYEKMFPYMNDLLEDEELYRDMVFEAPVSYIKKYNIEEAIAYLEYLSNIYEQVVVDMAGPTILNDCKSYMKKIKK